MTDDTTAAAVGLTFHRTRRRVIWKFALNVGGETTISVPGTAMPVLVGLDPVSGNLAVWMELDPDALRVDRHFSIYGTGQEIEGDSGFPYDIYVGSVIQGPFVWHVYERRAGA